MYRILYSNCWEDAEVVIKALDIKPGGTYLSIASAGDNTLSMLSHGPRLVLAVDKNPAQLACLEARKAAIEHLSRAEVFAFLGITPSDTRISAYRKIRPSLSPYARRFWDQRADSIKQGIIHIGRTERYFTRFRKLILPLIMNRRVQEILLHDMPEKERTRLCDRIFSTPRFQYTMRAVFSRAFIRQFRIGAYSRFYVSTNGNLANIIMKRVQNLFYSPLAHNNPYIDYIMNGNFTRALPHYLRPDVFPRIKKNLGSLRLFYGTLHDVLASHTTHRFNGFNLSDIFEYMNTHDAGLCIEQCTRAAVPGARLVHWSTLRKFDIEHPVPGRVRTLTRLTGDLFSMNKSFLYDSLVIAETI